MIPQIILWSLIAFASGSLMFSYWLGKAALNEDIRQVGDGNPGSTNVLKAGGWKLGALAFVLDTLKGAIPVAIAKYGIGIEGVGLVIVSLMPILGHAFTPFLRGHGGKAVAVSFGVWMALTFWEIPMLGGIALGLWYCVIAISGWAVVFMSLSIGLYLLWFDPNPVLYCVWVGNFTLFLHKYRADLRQKPQLRGWITERLWFSKRSAA